MPMRSQLSPRRQRLQSRSGWTLIEMTVAMFAGSMILTAIVTTTVFVSKSFIAIGNYTDLGKASRITLDTMSRDIRDAAALVSYATNAITLANQDGTQVTYDWYPATSHFMRSDSSGSKIMLTGCDFLNFHVYQRNPTNNFQFAPATTPSQTKLVDVSWRCSRKILGAKVNTESVQTAEIVIRN